MARIVALFLFSFAALAQAGIHQEKRSSPSPEKGVAVPKSDTPLRLQCWYEGRQQIVEALPPPVPPTLAETSTRVVIRNPGGGTTVVVVPGSGASGCLPVR